MPGFLLSNGRALATTNAGGALLFTANTNSTLTAPANAAYQLPTAITMECWINPQQPAAAGVGMPLFYNSRQASSYQWYVRLNSSGAAANRTSVLVVTHYGTNLGYTSLTLIPSDRWTHVAFTFDVTLPAGQLRIYINGQIDAIFNVAVASATLATPITLGIGSLDSSGTARFRGLIDTFRLWNYARSASQIADNYRMRLVPLESGLVANYGLDETGSTAFDRSGTANNAVVGGLSTVMARQGSTVPYLENTNPKLLTI